MTDSVGVTGWTYDPTGQLLTETNPTGATITHAYNNAGQQTGLTYPTGETITTTFDAAGLPVAQKSPFGELKYAFDEAGRLVKEVRSNGVDTTFGYDRAGRVTNITHQLPTDPTPTPLGPVPPGSGGNPAGGITPGDYLAGWDIPTAQGQIPAGGKIVSGYGYDTRSNVTTETNTVTTSGTDPAAGLAALLTPTTVAGVAAGSAKPVTSNTQTHTYDPLNRLTTTTTTNTPTTGATAGGAATGGSAGAGGAAAGGDGTSAYSYDAAGNRVSAITTGTDPTSITATFNNLNQIISSTGTHAATYTYDGAGQRTKETVDGLMTNYTWSPQNRLTKIIRDGRTTDNTYDGIGRLQTSTDTTTTPTTGGGGSGSGGSAVGQPTVTSSVWDGLSVLTETNPASGTTNMVRDITGNVAIQASTLTTPGTGIRWNLTDAQGSPVAQTIGGTVTEQATYGDYGNQTFNTPGWNATVGFGSEITDPTNHLNSYYARQYDPATATWLSPDPHPWSAAASQTQNRYAFVAGNPTTNTDYLGYCPLNSSDFTGGPRCGGQPTPAKHKGVLKDPQAFGPIPTVRTTPPPVPAHMDPQHVTSSKSKEKNDTQWSAATAPKGGNKPIDSSQVSVRHPKCEDLACLRNEVFDTCASLYLPEMCAGMTTQEQGKMISEKGQSTSFLGLLLGIALIATVIAAPEILAACVRGGCAALIAGLSGDINLAADLAVIEQGLTAGTLVASDVALIEARLAAARMAGTEAATATETIGAADHIVLGLRANGLETLAAKVGGRTLLEDAEWRITLLQAIADPSTKFTVSLDGMSGSTAYNQVMSAASRGANSSVGYTDWEMAQLYGGGRLSDTTFMRGGVVVENPFG
ncbi:hypothetical protein EH165_06525 [Nakamurella antarctica]|uniref:RHS repeat-associated core domain-containing protein n=1 Tax=Nakamurella antarctica TaxID=1902245 RepID=A0A3G8ZM54_9ACTN|nr:hypothetical protein EH165_06525 [Nakamurella antarctica]